MLPTRDFHIHRASSLTRLRERGQVLPIFVFIAIVLLGGAALVTDVAWLWMNQQRMERAGDAGALAGAIYLPGDPTTAYSSARAEAAKNGYVDGVGGVAVTPRRDPTNPRKLLVDVSGPVDTHFARVFCWDGGPCLTNVAVSATGAAEYVLPVPMGSPQNYYGVGYFIGPVTTYSTTPDSSDTGWRSETAVYAGQWTSPGNAGSDNDSFTTEDTDGHEQVWGGFGLLGSIDDSNTVITGLRVRLSDISINSSASDCQVQVQTSWDGGVSWSTAVGSGPLSQSSWWTEYDVPLGSSTSTAAWGAHSWIRADFSDANFRVRLTWHDGTASCPSDRSVRLDELQARVYFDYDRTTSSTTIEQIDITDPYDTTTLAAQNFWGTMQSQGATKKDGDAYMAYYDPRTSGTNDEYDPTAYYHYGVEIPAGASDGEVWLFDAGFCEASLQYGTGEYNQGSAPMSNFYDLYDTNDTPYNHADDTLVASANDKFRRFDKSDHSLGQTQEEDCSDADDADWHFTWWQLADNLAGDTTYRLHTYTTDPNYPTDQRSTNAWNSFAIWSTATGGTPRVYGLGAMEAYVRLFSNQSAEFYLAQIGAQHAGKTMVIRLWDPGDTNYVPASLQILQPTTSTYSPATFSYSAKRVAYNAASCDSRQGTGVTQMQTNTGGSNLFDGCWVTIEIPLPTDYAAPHPSSDTITSEGGWWKIRYVMGSGGNYTNDLTTWQVTLRGNPVHLVLE